METYPPCDLLPLYTLRLLLRDFSEDDWPMMYRIEADPLTKQHLPSDVADEQKARESVRWYMEQAVQEPRIFYDLAVVALQTSEVVGWCRLALRYDEVAQGEIAYMLRRDMWGHGLATEVALRLLAFGFTELKLHRIFATCRPANTASWRVLEKCGLQREGHLREHRWMKGSWHDSYLYAVLEREWRQK